VLASPSLCCFGWNATEIEGDLGMFYQNECVGRAVSSKNDSARPCTHCFYLEVVSRLWIVSDSFSRNQMVRVIISRLRTG